MRCDEATSAAPDVGAAAPSCRRRRSSWSSSVVNGAAPARRRSPGAGRSGRPPGPAIAAAAAWRRWRAARGRHQQRHEAERHGEDDPPVGTAPSNSRAQTFGGVGPSAKHGTAHDTHASRLPHSAVRRTGGADRGHAGRRGRGGRVRSGRPARPWSTRGRDGRRAPGPRRVASPRGAGRSGCGSAPPGRSPRRDEPDAASAMSGPSGADRLSRSLDRKSWRRRRQRMAERRSSTA